MESDYDLASVIELFRSLTEQDQQDILAMRRLALQPCGAWVS